MSREAAAGTDGRTRRGSEAGAAREGPGRGSARRTRPPRTSRPTRCSTSSEVGAGGTGGDAVGISVAAVSGSATLYWNDLDALRGGMGGHGGDGIGPDGVGGRGGQGVGLLAWTSRNADIVGGQASDVRGGLGGNSTATGVTGTASGGAGGEATGIGILGLEGAAFIHSTYVTSVAGGNGGRGSGGGAGGNETGVT